ncbi:LysR family transcriptional regulator [Nocardia transvalensis]|uniref:LysR family transcriptional regulator n=1 Tax=Nocardia transvalensis TaxID=37333 RepID=UPI0018963614|nr:LysR family transcriptional regulator [Nocardia transvalensis]MBF6328273.1 LysR family transcriptional regulator [Nocardia transvalensis]
MDITVQQARSFLAVAEELNFTRAAHRLHVSPSSLSELVATLERRVDRRLFHRTSRLVELTEAGRALRPLALRLVAAADAVNEWASALPPVTVRLGLTVSSPQFRDLFTALTLQRPQVRWRVRYLPFGQGYPALSEGTVDCLFIAEPRRPPAWAEAIPLWSEDVVVVMSEAHPLASRPELSLDDLAGETFVTAEDVQDSEHWLAGIRPGGDEPRVLPAAATLDEVLDLCGAGLGVNIAGSAAPYTYARQGIRYVPLRGLAPRTTYLCLRREPRSPELAHLTRISRRAAAELP